MEENIGYCVKCREKRKMVNAQEVTMNKPGGKTGRAMSGKCEKCGTKMFRILPAK